MDTSHNPIQSNPIHDAQVPTRWARRCMQSVGAAARPEMHATLLRMVYSSSACVRVHARARGRIDARVRAMLWSIRGSSRVLPYWVYMYELRTDVYMETQEYAQYFKIQPY
jgi:hypothetical protein